MGVFPSDSMAIATMSSGGSTDIPYFSHTAFWTALGYLCSCLLTATPCLSIRYPSMVNRDRQFSSHQLNNLSLSSSSSTIFVDSLAFELIENRTALTGHQIPLFGQNSRLNGVRIHQATPQLIFLRSAIKSLKLLIKPCLISGRIFLRTRK